VAFGIGQEGEGEPAVAAIRARADPAANPRLPCGDQPVTGAVTGVGDVPAEEAGVELLQRRTVFTGDLEPSNDLNRPGFSGGSVW
jgi:hypothetical protein